MNYIRELAELLECGMQCFFHKKNKSIEYYPDMDEVMSDMESWQDIMRKIEEDFDNYVKVSKMDSIQSFRVMERFTDQIDSILFREKAENILSRPKPFWNFKNLIEQSEFRQAWFDFRLNENMEWVKKQLDQGK